MTVFENTIRLPESSGDALALLLNFGISRAEVLGSADELDGAELVRPGEVFQVSRLDTGTAGRPLPPNALGVLVSDQDAWSETTELEVRSAHEKLEVVSLVEYRSEARTVLSSPGQPCLDTVLLWEQPLTGAATLSVLDYLNGVEAALYVAEDGPRTDYRWFFFDLDRRTDLHLAATYLSSTAKQQWNLNLATALSGLSKRFEHRLAEHQQVTGSYSQLTDAPTYATELQYFSTLFLELFHLHFPDGLGGIDYPRVEEAFEMFANGELRLQLTGQHPAWSCQPSSGYYFFFAELALMCVELGIDVAVWQELVNVLVRTQRIYTDVYPVADPDTAVLGGYSACAYQEARSWSCSEKASLRELFAGKTLDQLAVAAAQNALDDVGGGTGQLS